MQSARWQRAQDRACEQYLRKWSGPADCEPECPICQEPLKDDRGDNRKSRVVVTLCGHAYHQRCWSDYVQSKANALVSGLGARSSPHFTQACVYMTAIAGPPCPMCRQLNPTLHDMALRFADPALAKADKQYIKPDVNVSLAIATGQLPRKRRSLGSRFSRP